MKNRKMRSVLCVLLCLMLSLCMLLASCFGGGDKDKDKETDKPSETVTETEDHIPTETEMTEDEETEAPVSETETETETEIETEIETETETETETEAVTDEETEEVTEEIEGPAPDVTEEVGDGENGDIVGKSGSGTFVSTEAKNLVLTVNWEYEILASGAARVSVEVGVSHYRLFAQEKLNMGAIQVDGKATSFNTPKIEHDSNTKTYTQFYTADYTTDKSSMDIEATWQVLGKYGDVEIDSLNAGGTIEFGE